MAWPSLDKTEVTGDTGFPNQATAPGSSNYYCVRFAPAKLRTDLALVFAWQRELQGILHHCSDQGVALSKLQWYREELGRTLDGKAQHRLVQALILPIQTHQLPVQLFLDMAGGVETDILGAGHRDNAALHAYCRQSGGSLLVLLTKICGGGERELASAQELGAFVRLTEIIRNLGQDLRLGCCHLPALEMEKRNLTPAGLTGPQSEKVLHALLSDLSARALSWQESAFTNLPAGKYPALIPACAMAATNSALLQEIRKAGFPVLNQRLSLTPLRKLWIAWRTSRRIREPVRK